MRHYNKGREEKESFDDFVKKEYLSYSRELAQ
jgi:hypothetical protein